MEHYRVGIAIVNYKTSDLVCECLKGIAQLVTAADIKVCIVDNHSCDGSYERLIEEAQKPDYFGWVQVLDGARNGGFSYGNNLAAKHFADLDVSHFWMLNPDTYPTEHSLANLLTVFDRYPESGAVGSRLQDTDGTRQIAAFNFPRPLGEFVNMLRAGAVERLFSRYVVASTLPEKLHKVDWVAGASMLLRWEDFKSVGFMDEGYFLYFEEVDLCFKIGQLGRSIYYAPQSVVVHHVGAATGISDTRKKAPRRPRYWFNSRRRYFINNFGISGALIADVSALIGLVLYKMKVKVLRQPDTDPPSITRDLLINSIFFRGWKL